MNRRDAIGRVALLMGGAVIGAEFFLSGCRPNGASNVEDLFKQENADFLNEVAETILPTTAGSPGAKAAQVGQFMAVMVRDCYTPADQKTFIGGISKLNDASQKKYNAKFMDITPAQRTELLIAADAEQKEYYKQLYKKLAPEEAKHKGDISYVEPDLPNHYFKMMKEITLLGFFTSQVGATKALRYVETPGHFDGCVPYKKGDKAWADA
ncbi:gluconate 2-dehydrogenase subunit 3 family protein [Mucilaginibacter sp.]|uniref:gluconate 2-dehydrogenase subunit 3 family protein n=1 Tax=Mucilaginibacter sp. TaxID=1882438 RepID=UPI0028484A91|nr:gluconate 2-dehydrogenase subunit 3 family protein [Mucilaginibacter sp.]MDR3697364.1 gluconate 2-dehydrogenase subunit 3 family protein [Mucilaginibacter sp.]